MNDGIRRKAALTCSRNQIPVTLGGSQPVCKKRCNSDTDCAGGAKGACALAATVAGGKAVHVCVNE